MRQVLIDHIIKSARQRQQISKVEVPLEKNKYNNKLLHHIFRQG